MTSSMLKVIACLLMLVDHVGAALFPDAIFLRVIGRLSFPIFAYLVSIGYSKTNSFSKYLCRLSIFAVLSQMPFSLAFSKHVRVSSFADFFRFLVGSPYPHLNVFCTLALGLIAIRIWDIENHKRDKIIAVLALGVIAESCYTDYGIYGVVMILAFYIFKENKIKTVISQSVIYVLFNVPQILLYIYKLPGAKVELVWFIQALSLLALLFIFRYNGKKGKDLKFFFYAFYPVHLLIIGLIKILM